jgi:hypothetical protein
VTFGSVDRSRIGSKPLVRAQKVALRCNRRCNESRDSSANALSDNGRRRSPGSRRLTRRASTTAALRSLRSSSDRSAG